MFLFLWKEKTLNLNAITFIYFFDQLLISIQLCFWKSMKKNMAIRSKGTFFIMHLLSFLFNFKPQFFDVFSTHNMDFHCFFFFFLKKNIFYIGLKRSTYLVDHLIAILWRVFFLLSENFTNNLDLVNMYCCM